MPYPWRVVWEGAQCDLAAYQWATHEHEWNLPEGWYIYRGDEKYNDYPYETEAAARQDMQDDFGPDGPYVFYEETPLGLLPFQVMSWGIYVDLRKQAFHVSVDGYTLAGCVRYGRGGGEPMLHKPHRWRVEDMVPRDVQMKVVDILEPTARRVWEANQDLARAREREELQQELDLSRRAVQMSLRHLEAAQADVARLERRLGR